MIAALDSGYFGLAWHLTKHPADLRRLHRLPDSVLLGTIRVLPLLQRCSPAELVDHVERWSPSQKVEPERLRLLRDVRADQSSLTAAANFAKYAYLQQKTQEIREVVPDDHRPAPESDGIWTEVTYHDGPDTSSIQSGWTTCSRPKIRVSQNYVPPIEPDDPRGLAASIRPAPRARPPTPLPPPRPRRPPLGAPRATWSTTRRPCSA